MKSKTDPRHKRRILLIQALYSSYFNKDDENVITLPLPVADKLKLVQKYQTPINKIIDRFTVSFPAAKMNKIDLAILQLALYELLYIKKEPCKVIIDESIELAKEFGNVNSPKFVNGILGKVIENYQIC